MIKKNPYKRVILFFVSIDIKINVLFFKKNIKELKQALDFFFILKLK